MTPDELEAQIREAWHAMNKAGARADCLQREADYWRNLASQHADLMSKLIALRSPETIKRMEKEHG